MAVGYEVIHNEIEKIDDLRNGFTTLSTADVQIYHSNLASAVSSLVNIVDNGYNISYGLNSSARANSWLGGSTVSLGLVVRLWMLSDSCKKITGFGQ
jgi:hypothetical protein